MWDIHDIQDGYVHGEGLQNGTESQVGKDQMGGESEKGERGERRDGGEMEGEEQNEKSGQGVQSSQQKTLKSRKPLLQDLSSCSTMTPQGRFLEGAGTVAPRVCRCPFGCSRQIDGRYPHAVFCYTCGPRSKHMPEDPCRCAEAGAICCAADPDNDQGRSAPPLPPLAKYELGG